MRVYKIVGCLLAALTGAMAAPMAMAAPEDMLMTNNAKEPNTKHMGSKEMTKKPATGMPNSPTTGNGKPPVGAPILYLVGDSTMAATAVADESLPASGSNEGNPSSVEDSAEEQVSLRKRDEDDTGKSAGTNNGEPAGTNNGEPAGTKNGEPAGTKNGQPAGTSNGKPAGTKNGEPAGTNNGEPAGTNNGKPAGTNKPAGTKNGEPAGNNNGEPKTVNNHKAPVKLERQGWGSALPEFMKIQIVNLAISGRSARSYTNENRFKTLATKVKKGDYVVIQFGHNDVGTPKSKIDNGRAACPPVNNKYSTTCKTTFQ